jgi:hypothetical protein
VIASFGDQGTEDLNNAQWRVVSCLADGKAHDVRIMDDHS